MLLAVVARWILGLVGENDNKEEASGRIARCFVAVCGLLSTSVRRELHVPRAHPASAVQIIPKFVTASRDRRH